MEKFNANLSSVFREFDFSQDSLDQASSSVPQSQGISSPSPSQYFQHQDITSSGDLEIKQLESKNEEVNLLLDCDNLVSNIDNIRKPDVNKTDLESVNDFYTHDDSSDDKLQQKCVHLDVGCENSNLLESSALTIRNDISSQKLLQKIPNEDINKQQNLVLPCPININLNSFSGPTRGEPSVDKSHSLLDDPVTCNANALIDDPIILVKKDNDFGSVTHKYQNILLPVKLDSCSNESKVQQSDIDLNFPELKNLIDHPSEEHIQPEKCFKSIIDEPDHVYENVYIGTDIPKAQDIYSTSSKIINKRIDMEHDYENINFKNSKKQGSEEIYGCVYSGGKEGLPETTTELEIAAKKMADHLNVSKNEEQNAVNASVNSGASSNVNTAKLVFQNVQLSSSRQQVTSQPSIGFKVIDDMSEEELNKYIAELEAEERIATSTKYENLSLDKSIKKIKRHVQKKPFLHSNDDEDANEAPIFEAVMIGELPNVPPEHLHEKSKKFPKIDYSSIGSSSGIGESSSKAYAEIEDENNKLRRIKQTHEKIRMSSDNSDHDNQTTEENDFNINIVENFKDKENGDKPNLSSGSIRHTETISRFSVTTNVDINDKLGGDFRPLGTLIPDSLCLEDEFHHAGGGGISEHDSNKKFRPKTLDIVPVTSVLENSSSETEDNKNSGRVPSPANSECSSMDSGVILGKQAPFWVPDSDAPNCMLCDMKFTVMKRRHHCRACGKVLCNKCCNMKYKLQYQGNTDSRVCISCYQLLSKAEIEVKGDNWIGYPGTANNLGINSPQERKNPNPHNPMEYCSTIPPLQQLAGNFSAPPSVMVPVGVLKREGSTKQRTDGPKSVMFSDGIRPGCDLTELDTTWDWKLTPIRKSGSKRAPGNTLASPILKEKNFPPADPDTSCYVPNDPGCFPPMVTIVKGQISYHEVTDITNLQTTLKNECEPPVMFAINRNLYALVKIINLSCCVNRVCWNVTSKGLAYVGQDEVVFLIETLPDEKDIPKDLLLHINQIYCEAIKGNPITEYGMSIHQIGNLLGFREHAGFLFIRQTLQCLQKIILPPAPFLFGLLVHRWETPWAKVFPLRLVLRLGAEYRYYPCPLVSVRFRDAVYFEIGHTIMKVLADFRNFAYTLPRVQGLTIHMQDRTTYIRFPKNRYNQVIKGLNHSNDHVLAFAANFSIQADSHLVCMQTNLEDESTYQTQAINIQNKPRKVTGASFIVINGALKSSMGLSAKCSILEDGLMVQIMPEKMEALKASFKNMQDFTIGCGFQGSPEPDEVVYIKWVENDTQFNLGVKSPIDRQPMDGIASIRVHNGVKCIGTSRFIRWTEVFIIKSDDEQPFGIQCPVDINKLSESIARATCAALVKLLDLLANAGLTKIAVRTTIHPDNVGYEAGSEGMRLPPLYMKSLDNEIIKVLQRAVQGCEDMHTVLELIFYVLETDKNMC